MYLLDQARGSHCHNCILTSAAVDQEATEADEGIGESETDVGSSTDADASCASFISSFPQRPSNITNSTLAHDNIWQHSTKQCDKQTATSNISATEPVSADGVPAKDENTPEHSISCNDQGCQTDATEEEHLLQSQNHESNVPNSTSVNIDDQGSPEDVSLSEDSGGSFEVPKPSSPSDDDAALSEDSGSSQTLSVTQSLNDDDQGSLTETAQSDEDSGSSRTVEVFDCYRFLCV